MKGTPMNDHDQEGFEDSQLVWANALDDVAIGADGMSRFSAIESDFSTPEPIIEVHSPIFSSDKAAEAARHDVPPLRPKPQLPEYTPSIASSDDYNDDFKSPFPPVHPQHTPSQSPPPLPPRDAPGKPAATGNFGSALAHSVTKRMGAISEKQALLDAEARAFNRAVLSELPANFFTGYLGNTENRSFVKFVTVEQVKQPILQPHKMAAQISSITSRIAGTDLHNTADHPSTILDVPNLDPSGTLLFINIAQISCLIHKPSLNTSKTETRVILTKQVPSPLNSYLRLPNALESFPLLAQRLPPYFIVVPLVTDALRKNSNINSTSPAPQNTPHAQVAINANAVVSVSPFDMYWTNVVVLGDVRKPRSNVDRDAPSSTPQDTETTPAAAPTGNDDAGPRPSSSSSVVAGMGANLQAAAKRAMETATRQVANVKQSVAQSSGYNHGGGAAAGGGGASFRDGGSSTFAFQVALSFASVLKLLDEGAF
ncbi:hypothetical protein BJ741DRAFT_627276 [Chytriomyces cf. hyalinus JEL632]|nr:hypothetical protein BJ741DRAFT_627276 [Chytriomyces cf. hyalinus JEL632]